MMTQAMIPHVKLSSNLLTIKIKMTVLQTGFLPEAGDSKTYPSKPANKLRKISNFCQDLPLAAFSRQKQHHIMEKVNT